MCPKYPLQVIVLSTHTTRIPGIHLYLVVKTDVGKFDEILD